MPWTQKQMLRDANGDLIPQYWDVVEQEFKPLTGSDGANDVRLTGSIVELIEHRIVESRNTNNLWIGDTVYEAARLIYGIDVSQYRKINMLIINRTERPIVLRGIYYGTQFDRRDQNERILLPMGDIPINVDDHLFIGAIDFNENSDYKEFFNIPLPFFVFHLFRGTEEVMGDGEIEFKLFGLK